MANKFTLDHLLKTAKPESIPVLYVMGGTATGKTDTAAQLYEQLPAELISVDSSLVYRGMNIGTAKPDPAFLEQYPHHLIDIRNPDETYSAADFCSDAASIVQQVTKKGKIPILVGGTSFYFSALENGLPELPVADPEIRQSLDQEAAKQGWQYMHSKLANLDPESAKRIKPTDTQRIQRALEINLVTGTPVKQLNNSTSLLKNPILKTALFHTDRHKLHTRIKQRFSIMIENGLLDEITSLQQKYPKEIPAFRMIGYRQIIEGLDCNESLDSIIEKSIIATRQLAKRQLTWLRNQSNVLWVALDKLEIVDIAYTLNQYYSHSAEYLLSNNDN